PEFWGGFVEDADNDGKITEYDRMAWNDKVLDGKGFINWKSYNHPELGEVEIGGWNRKFTFQNPPPKLLKSEIEKYVEWMLWLAETSPLLQINTVEVSPVIKGKVVSLTAEIQNVGYLSTNITQRAIDAKLIQPARAILELEDAELISGKLRMDLGHITGARESSDTAEESKRILNYGIQITGKNPVARLRVESEKGGIVEKVIKLK
ncbi:MAG: hypothetical protein KDE26_03205, partial [Bacteroidetes bacterium]|nr:hypothetical protein [Bacteroidota bacterium]